MLSPKTFENARSLIKEEQIVRVVGKLQIKENVPQILAEEITEMEVQEEQPREQVEQEFLGLIIPDEKILNEVLDICECYPGNIPVIVAMNGKKYNAHVSVRKVEGLLAELKGKLKESDIIFFRKKC